MTHRLWSFPGGLHLPGHKALSTGTPIRAAAIPRFLILPLQQHIGAPAKPLVAVGDTVDKGQMIAAAEGYVSAPVHASSSGRVVAIEERPIPHPSGLSGPSIVIETDGKERWGKRKPVADYRSLDPSALRNVIRDAGIVGLGGAGFPAYVKLNPGSHTAVETLVLNGAECEPYITCDDMLMRERADEIVAGARIMRHALQARRCVLGVEDNKPEAIAALGEALERLSEREIEVVPVPTRYPTGGEKQLIKVLTGREVPAQGLPIAVGVVCHNVATAASVHRAVERGEPLISRIVTVTGGGVAAPGNREVLIGTPMAELLQESGGPTPAMSKLIMGGPMMGFTVREPGAPVIKTTNCLLAATAAETGERPGPVLPCIRCGECAKACPVSLLPQQLYWHARAKDFDKAQDHKLFDCIECGCCAYVCPSNLPLVQYFRFAKTEIWTQEREKKKADIARERHEFRQARIEREKAERAARMQKKQAEAAAKEGSGTDDKKAAIKAAMERAKAKRAQAGTEPRNTENLTEAQQRQIAEAEARRARAKAENSTEEN